MDRAIDCSALWEQYQSTHGSSKEAFIAVVGPILKDAERYRWIRANEHSELTVELCMEVPAEDWDAAIDKAMKA